VGRGVSRRVAAAETLQLIGAFSDPLWLIGHAPRLADYMEPEGYFHGAYGKRIDDQLLHVYRKLKTDLNTRQAVIQLWDADLDNSPGMKDYPCTVALGFTTYLGIFLNMNVLMRSNDVWLGLPYDMFQFTQLQLTLARLLGLEPGTYTHTAWSMHLYLDDIEKSYRVTDPVMNLSADYQPVGIFGPNVKAVRDRAYVIAYTKYAEPDDLAQLNQSERWYAEALQSTWIERSEEVEDDGAAVAGLPAQPSADQAAA